jgi:hypothetical protein
MRYNYNVLTNCRQLDFAPIGAKICAENTPYTVIKRFLNYVSMWIIITVKT